MTEKIGKCHDCTAPQTEVNMLSRHILELQADKGRLTDRVRELEAEVKEWKDKADLWCKTTNLKDHNIMINKELEKENAELRKVAEFQQSSNMNTHLENKKIKEVLVVGSMWNRHLNSQNKALEEERDKYRDMTFDQREQLTKAKELLKKLLVHSKRYIRIADDNNKPIMQKEIAEAEQFLENNA